MEKTNKLIPPPWGTVSVLVVSLLVMGFIVMNAWVSDDAYITFRFIDNVVEGYGLRWNIYERVQAYTHPLWMLIHIPFYAVWDNIFLINIWLSLLCTAGAIAISLRTFDRPAHLMVLCFLLPLGLSKVFVEYSTSGLENPLSHLLFACFGYVLIKKQQSQYFWFYCSLIVALALVNRLDTIILYLPVLTWLTVIHHKTIRWRQVFLGAVPLMAWFVFALFYYGFLFPNTKYAKLNSGIDSVDLMQQGVLYFLELFSTDAFTYMFFCVLLARLFESVKDTIAFRIFRKELDKPPPSVTLIMIGLGVFAYITYVIIVGGDFMSGRFFSLPYFVTVWLIFYYIADLNLKRAAICLVFLLALKYQAISMAADSIQRCMDQMKDVDLSEFTSSQCLKSGIADERAFYSPTRVWYYDGTFSSDRIRDDVAYNKVQQVLKKPNEIYLFGAIGALGYYSGPRVRFVDYQGLTDPLLARLPTNTMYGWRIGHFQRDIPDGYIFAIRHHRADQMHPALRAYYKPLRLIVSGDLFDPERLKAIIAFNLGHYDHFREEYLRNEDAIKD